MAFDALDNFIEIQKLREELRAKSGNLVTYDKSLVAEVDGQIEFTIDLSTFNAETDSVFVHSGKLRLSPVLDFVITGNKVVLNEGVPIGRTIDITVLKNVENLDEEKVIDGRQIGVGTIPLDRLSETIVTSDVPIHFSVNESGGITVTYDNGN